MKNKLLYVFPKYSSFVRKDHGFFERQFQVLTFEFNPRRKLYTILEFILQKLFLLCNIRSASIIICQFAGYHSLLPVLFARIFRKPCLINVGGTDCASFPSINYGNLRKPLLAWFTLKSLKYATHISSPSASLIEYNYTYRGSDYPKQGYKYFAPLVKTPATVIFNSVDTSIFYPVPGIVRKKNSFLTICGNIDKRTYLLKGIDLVIASAKIFPACHFTIIGRMSPGFSFKIPVNVTLIDFIPNEQLPEVISAHTYYCQLSISEGFPLALIEAMACGCVPIVSRVAILDFIIGDSGFILEKYDRELLKKTINQALEADVDILSQDARVRVIRSFTDQIRETALIGLIKGLTNK